MDRGRKKKTRVERFEGLGARCKGPVKIFFLTFTKMHVRCVDPGLRAKPEGKQKENIKPSYVFSQLYRS